MKEFWQKFKKGLFTKTQFLTGVTLSLLFTSGLVWAFTVANMTTFTSGTTISATQVNDNFTYLKERLEALSGGKFVVSTSAPQAFPTVPCCGPNTQKVDFDTVDFDIAGSGLAFTGTDEITVTESSFYELSIVSQVDGSTANNQGEVIIQKLTGGVGTPTNVRNLYVNSVGGPMKGERTTYWLNSGDLVEVVAQGGCCAGTAVTLKPGTKFSFRKL